MAFKIVNEFPSAALENAQAPFISLYQPTHRHRPQNQQDVIRFKNLVRRIEESLKRGYSSRQIEAIMKPFHTLAADVPFWNHTLDGLAILAGQDGGVIYKLRRPVKELAVVADSFHVKPLIRTFQSADRYHVLGLSRSEFVLYEGNRYGFDPVELEPDTPRSIEQVLGDERSEKYVTFGSYAGVGGKGAFHGHGGRKEEVDKNTRRFFRHVERFVWENFSRPSGLPLILVSLAEHQAVFRQMSRNQYLMEDGIKTSFDALTMDQLKASVWEKIEPVYLAKTKKLVDDFTAAQAKFMASADLAQVARAAWEERIATLLVEADRIVAGKVDPASGRLLEGDLTDPQYDDVLDDLAEMVYNTGGEVVVLPKERMPTTTGAAATFRF